MSRTRRFITLRLTEFQHRTLVAALDAYADDLTDEIEEVRFLHEQNQLPTNDFMFFLNHKSKERSSARSLSKKFNEQWHAKAAVR